MSFLTVFGAWGYYSGILAQKLQKVYQKCNLCVQKLQGELGTFDRFVKTALYLSEWDFWLNCFLWIFWDSSMFSDCGQKILQHWQRKFREVVKSAFYLNNRTFRGKFVFWRKSLLLQIFRVLMKKTRELLSERVPPDLKNCFLHSFRGLFE